MKSANRWPLILGVLFPSMALAIFAVVRHPQSGKLASEETIQDQTVAVAASKRGLDSKAIVEGLDLMRKAESTGNLSDADWAATKRLLSHPQSEVQAEALSVMMHLQHSSRRDEAIQIAHKERDASNSHVRRTALILLYHLRASDWQAEVEKAKQSQDPDDRDVAEAILSKEAGSLPTDKP